MVAEPKCRPILFSGEMVRAILDGRKMQTRRVIKPQPEHELGELPGPAWNDGFVDVRCPYGRPGDRLWVKESYRLPAGVDSLRPGMVWEGATVWHEATDGVSPTGCPGGPGKLRPSIFMRRWMSRITLEIAGVRVERVQGIDIDGVGAEGVDLENEGRAMDAFGYAEHFQIGGVSLGSYRMPEIYAFAELWDSINAKRGHPWESNPWVWVVEFRRLQP